MCIGLFSRLNLFIFLVDNYAYSYTLPYEEGVEAM